MAFAIQLAFDLREVDEIIEIVSNLPSPVDTATLRLLQRLHGGEEHPDDDKAGHARESQYELYLGSVLRRAGINAKHGEPDLAAMWREKVYHLEAKRPSSADRVDDRLRSAVRQLRLLSEPGIVALCLDQVVRPANKLLLAPTLDAVAPEVNDLITKYVAQNTSMWKRRLPAEPVDAILFTARVPARLMSTGHLVLGSNLHIEVLARARTGTSAEFIQAAAAAYMAAQGPP